MTLSRLDLFDDVAVRLDGVSLRYDTSEDILSGIDLVLKPGSFSFLTGASGAGKTSLLKLLYLALKPSMGEVSLFGRPTSRLTRDQLSALRRRVGVVFQEFRLLDHLTAYENVALPLRVLGRKEASYRSDVQELLAWVGLGERMHARPPTLSGGEQQRVAIARAVVTQPDILIADEPTGNVDPEMGSRLMRLFLELNKRRGTTVIIATHDLGLVRQVQAPVYRLQHGLLVQDAEYSDGTAVAGRRRTDPVKTK
ncbi:cell division ATP-binding protein FtsE [Hyphomonas pacifica]|uniref:Cell division ATP-binding protein FtsE n=1 Tax=Hyphomonas pacifica TaxID=1280941 RepID=A0A062TW29_9PROT|nr:cell division ATP-binding protein FtsE [Hyphomonas pacifica]KCZ50232.1 cell division protein FtsE [Hyphomonas pacifica]RAN32182.1 cell division protein FtsE [Hyphomonas pacifica]RAN33557.1 cell division protein FtsE [Hyphomonas pacifica]